MPPYVTTEDCRAHHEALLAKLDSIDRRLFKDNGTLSIQTRLDRHEQILRVLIWALSVVGGAILLAAVTLAIATIRHALMQGPTP